MAGGLSAQISAALCSWIPIRTWSKVKDSATDLMVEPSPSAASSSAAAANDHTLGSAKAASLRTVKVSP